MLTIRYINTEGREEIWETKNVSVNPANRTSSGLREIFAPGESHEGALPYPIRAGEVYVMNAAGKTVAAYNLNYQTDAAERFEAGAPPIPAAA